MFRRLLTLLLPLLVLAGCQDHDLPTALAPEGAASLSTSITCNDVEGLISAIEAANNTPGGAVIDLASGCTYTLTSVNNTDFYTGPNGLPSISDHLTIIGNGATIQRSSAQGTPDFRIFQINSGVTVSISGLTIAEGFTTYGDGGGIYNYGTLTLSHSTVSGNFGFAGGGIYNDGTLTLSHSTVSDNVAVFGGGIINFNGTVTLQNSTVSGNTSGDAGGGIYNGGAVTLQNSTVSGNMMTSGVTGAGGIYNYGTLTLSHSTVSDNRAPVGGGHIHATGGIRNYGTLTLKNTIIANSIGGDCVNDGFFGGTVNDVGYNLVEDGSCIGASTSRSGDPNLGPLADNGGPTRTHALLPGSAAIDAGDPDFSDPALPYDQRGSGFPRVRNGRLDIGAFEVQQTPPPVDNTPPSISITTPAQGAAYLLGQVVEADYSCQDEAGGSGLASCTGTVAHGAAIHTATVGTKSFQVDAADQAGNTAFRTHGYRVEYEFVGFEAPIENGGVRNVAKAGQMIPLKWRLTDAQGNPVTTLSSAQVSVTFDPVICESGAPEDPVGGDSPGGSGLQNLGGGRYQFNWQTNKNLANKCGTMHLNLGEGTTRTALFRFTK